MKNRVYGQKVTILLSVILVLIIMILWSLFISGPSRVHEVTLQNAFDKITEENKGITGLTVHQFDYTTYQGYTTSTLYWFDENCDIITTREIATLNYEAAKEKALNEYGIECKTIELGYGYDNPVYEICSKDQMILLDYDTLERVYERGL